MDYAADDGAAIKARMAEIAKENAPLVNRLDSLHDIDLDAAGTVCGLPRFHCENDYDYRKRLKVYIQTGLP